MDYSKKSASIQLGYADEELFLPTCPKWLKLVSRKLKPTKRPLFPFTVKHYFQRVKYSWIKI